MENREMARSGTIVLRSGEWSWVADDRWQGTRVVLQHRTRPWDEMRTWAQGKNLAMEVLKELILNPLERTWTDGSGLRWKLSLESPRDRHRTLLGAALRRQEERRLTFKRPGTTKVAVVLEATHLAELTHEELLGLLDEVSATGASGESLRIPHAPSREGFFALARAS